MSIIEINSCNVGSTGGIMLSVAKAARKSGFRVYTCCAYSRTNMAKYDGNTFLIGSKVSHNLHILLGKYFGLSNIFSIISTLFLLRKVKKNNCDLIHLHNLHDCYINLPLLFYYIKKHHIPVVWTLHDCWSFTGRCPYFDLTQCNKWQNGCGECPYPKNSYPEAKIDTSRMMWNLKKSWFTGLEKCTIVAPSHWLADLVKKSFLKEYSIKVINNGIDLSVFKPTENNFRERFGLVGKKIVLGVAFGWGKRKGLDIFIELSRRLPEEYRIVLVGTNNEVDAQLTSNFLSIHRTQNQGELVEIYTAADVFANPTREEVLGLVNVESLACGTPVVTFNTGGSPECIDETCGSVVNCDDVDAMEIEIRRICDEKPYSKEACLKRAMLFDMNNRYAEYVNLYRDVCAL